MLNIAASTRLVGSAATQSEPGRQVTPKSRWSPRRGWELIAFLPLVVAFLTPASWPRWAWMWLVCLAVYFGCKWLTWRRTSVAGIIRWKAAAYLFAWPGLDADAFLQSGSSSRISNPNAREWIFAAAKTAFGALMIWLVPNLVRSESVIIQGWIGMIGIVFLLHFGLFHLLSCLWRACGIDAKPLMDWPIAATSVSDFWGRRWNRAFRDLTHRFLFRPLTSWFGPRWGLAAGFLFSGLVHELVITVPARGGYGGPTSFFAIQAAAMLIERSRSGRRVGLGKGIAGWAFTVIALLAPAGILFPVPFLANIILPFINALGS